MKGLGGEAEGLAATAERLLDRGTLGALTEAEAQRLLERLGPEAGDAAARLVLGLGELAARLHGALTRLRGELAEMRRAEARRLAEDVRVIAPGEDRATGEGWQIVAFAADREGRLTGRVLARAGTEADARRLAAGPRALALLAAAADGPLERHLWRFGPPGDLSRLDRAAMRAEEGEDLTVLNDTVLFAKIRAHLAASPPSCPPSS